MAKDRTTEMAGKIRDAAKLNDPIARAVINLVAASLEETKESLVMAEGNDMLRTQGAARYLRKLHRELTMTPPSINTAGATE